MKIRTYDFALQIGFSIVGLAIVVGNVLHIPPLWGFNYYVLNIPYRFGGEIISNFIILWISFFPFFPRKQKLAWIHLLLVVIGLLILSTKLAVMVLAALGDHLYFGEPTSSIFYYPTGRWAAHFLVIPYLVWSLNYCSLSAKAKLFLLTALGISSIVAAAYIIY